MTLELMVVASYGADVLQQVEHRTGGSATTDVAARLVAEMADIRLAMQAPDAAAIRRESGWLGRLLGRDVEAQLRAEALMARLETCLLRADAAAAALRAELAAYLADATQLDRAVAAIEQWADSGEPLLPLIEDLQDPLLAQGLLAALQRRLQHLRSVAALRRQEGMQLQLLHAQGSEMLERYLRIREVLLPVWQQQRLAARGAQGAVELQQAAQSQQQILAEVEAMQARLR